MRAGGYAEGDWIAVPLRNYGFAVGRIARIAKRGRIALGYFFGPRRAVPPSVEELRNLTPADAIAVRQFSDLSLRNGQWRVLDQQGERDRDRWPVPDFGRYVEFDDRAWRVRYPEDDINGVPDETPITPEEGRCLPPDGLLGAGAVELLLTRLLSETPRQGEGADRPSAHGGVGGPRAGSAGGGARTTGP